MNPGIDPAARPPRIPVWARIIILLFLLLSFVSGILIWWGQTLQESRDVAPAWLHLLSVVHGSLYPVQCIVFGALAVQHIRIGWQMRANLISGFLMEFIFVGLILTGAGLYYVGSE